MSSEYTVEMKGIVKKFGGLVAVNDVNFDVKPGEIHALAARKRGRKIYSYECFDREIFGAVL